MGTEITTTDWVDGFFANLGILFYSVRHAVIVRGFLEGGQKDDEAIKNVLDKLGSWDGEDFEKVKQWLRENELCG